MADHSSMRLGKRPRRHDMSTLRLAKYLTAALPAPPAAVDYTHGIADWGMMLNDQLGCCTIAAVGHAVQAWSANALGRESTVPDADVLKYYEQWDGYNPTDPNSDQGGVELDVLNKWHQQGFDGVSLDAYVAIDLGNSGLGSSGARAADPSPSAIALAIWLFGGAYIGIELPIRAQDQDVWDVPADPGAADEPGSWGGHAVYLVGYDNGGSALGARNSGKVLPPSPQFAGITNEVKASAVSSPESPTPTTLTCITWGKPKKMTAAWFAKYCSEAYALVSKEWLESTGVSPSGFDLATLEADLQAVTA